MEECGELVQACSKIIRHGTSNPKYIENLANEMGDVIAMCEVVQEEFSLSRLDIETAVSRRHKKVKNIDYE